MVRQIDDGAGGLRVTPDAQPQMARRLTWPGDARNGLPVRLLLPFIRFGRAGLVILRQKFVRRGHGDDGWPSRAEASTNLLFGGAAWRHARDNPTQARSAPQPRQAQKTHWQVQCIVRPVLCSRSKLTWLFGSMAAGQGQPASFDFAQSQLPTSLARDVVSDQSGLRDFSLS
jgi:hypothetical protein